MTSNTPLHDAGFQEALRAFEDKAEWENGNVSGWCDALYFGIKAYLAAIPAVDPPSQAVDDIGVDDGATDGFARTVRAVEPPSEPPKIAKVLANAIAEVNAIINDSKGVKGLNATANDTWEEFRAEGLLRDFDRALEYLDAEERGVAAPPVVAREEVCGNYPEFGGCKRPKGHDGACGGSPNTPPAAPPRPSAEAVRWLRIAAIPENNGDGFVKMLMPRARVAELLAFVEGR